MSNLTTSDYVAAVWDAAKAFLNHLDKYDDPEEQCNMFRDYITNKYGSGERIQNAVEAAIAKYRNQYKIKLKQ